SAPSSSDLCCDAIVVPPRLLFCFLFFLLLLPPHSTLFPYTTLFRSPLERVPALFDPAEIRLHDARPAVVPEEAPHGVVDQDLLGDRKSTRLNSSHVEISYAVFCLKKKKKTRNANNLASRNLLICGTVKSRSHSCRKRSRKPFVE